VLGHEIGERVPAAGAPPALACFMAGRARAFFDDGFGAAVRTAGDGWIGWR
jgi:hypothetical protein